MKDGAFKSNINYSKIKELQKENIKRWENKVEKRKQRTSKQAKRLLSVIIMVIKKPIRQRNFGVTKLVSLLDIDDGVKESFYRRSTRNLIVEIL